MLTPTITKPKIVLKNGRPSEVILKWQDFRALLEKLEDAYDVSEIKKIKKNQPRFKNLDTLLEHYAV